MYHCYVKLHITSKTELLLGSIDVTSMDPNNNSVFENESFYMTLLVLNCVELLLIVITVASSRQESSLS